MFGFFQQNGKNEHPQDHQDEANNNEPSVETADATNVAAPVVQHGIIATDEVLLDAGVGSATPGSTVAEADRLLGKEAQTPPTPQAAGSNRDDVQEQPSAYVNAKGQHGLVERQAQEDNVDTTIVKKGHRVIQTQEVSMANEMKRKAREVLQEHKRRLGANPQ